MAEEDESFRDEKGRFKKGNLFSLGLENSGRPPEYDDYNVMAQRLADYLDYEDRFKGTKHKGLYTIEGACLFLGFATRDSMYDYEKKSTEFSYIVNRFKLFLTHWNAQKLYWGQTFSGSQFWLRNFGGYTDESTVKQHQTVTTVQPSIISGSPKLTNDEKQIDV
jgi:hypothetical protein